MDPTPSIDLAVLRLEAVAIEASICRESFVDFVRLAWPVIEPTRTLLPSVAIDAMCAALQAVADGRIRRLAISTCPGTSKSKIGAIAWPAWLLLRTGGSARIMVGSYSFGFASRDSRFCRDLIGSDWYQSLVAGAWAIRDDADTRDDYLTTTSGRRLIVAVGGKTIGERATIQLLDDVLAGDDIHSPSAKSEAVRWVNEALPSRLEDPEENPRVIIGQRLAVDDPIADVLRQGWRYLYLPAVLEHDGIASDPCELRDDAGDLVWRDPRGPSDPIVSLLGPEALASLEVELGSATFAAQYLQRPADDSVAMIKRTWWRFYAPPGVRADAKRPAGCDDDTETSDRPEHWDRVTIAADLTFGSVDGDWAVVQAWGVSGTGRYLIEQWRERAGFELSLAAIRGMAGRHPLAKVIVEKAANGAAVIEMLRKEVPGVVAMPPRGKKAMRLAAIAPTVESGCCYLPLGWSGLAAYVEELAGATKHDDQSDTTAYAVADLAYFDATPQGGFHGIIGTAADVSGFGGVIGRLGDDE